MIIEVLVLKIVIELHHCPFARRLRERGHGAKGPSGEKIGNNHTGSSRTKFFPHLAS